MRYLTIAFFLFKLSSSVCQIQLDSCGIDNKSELNRYEVSYLDSIFSMSDFTFENKTILFSIGNYGHNKITKNQYFNDVKNWWKHHNDRIHEDLIILTESEKMKFGNYDAIIISWSKIPLTEKTRIKFLRNISKENSK